MSNFLGSENRYPTDLPSIYKGLGIELCEYCEEPKILHTYSTKETCNFVKDKMSAEEFKTYLIKERRSLDQTQVRYRNLLDR